MAEQKSTTIRLKAGHHSLLKDVAEKNNRTLSGQANWLLEIVWYLEETRPQIYNEIVSELTELEYPLASVRVRRKQFNKEDFMFKENTISWLKAIFFVSLIFTANLVFAADSVTVTELNTSATDAKSVINFIAKWGGMATVIVTGILIIMGKVKGEMASVLAAVAVGVGVIAAAYGTYQTRISEGADFTSIHHVQIQTKNVQTPRGIK